MNRLTSTISAGLLAVTALVFSGCTLDSQKGLLNYEKIEVSPAPDIHGTSKEIESHSGVFNIRGGVRIGSKATAGGMTLTNDRSGLPDCDDCGGFDTSPYKKSYLAYLIQTDYVYGSVEYIHKMDLLEWGVGGGYENDPYISGIFGINTKHFEGGVSLFLGLAAQDYTVYGHYASCDRFWNDGELYETDFDDSDWSLEAFFGSGFFLSTYISRFSLTYSAQMHWYTNPLYIEEDENLSIDHYGSTQEQVLPVILTNHLSVGFNVTEQLMLRIGATNVVGEFKGWHFSGFGGFEYSL